MPPLLVLFAHPALEKSRIHRRLVRELPSLPGVTLHDLYEEYPAFDIDVDREKELLLAHDLIVMQHPLFWYSTPPILKQWQDLVLEHGWAYGRTGTALRGKSLLNLVTAGGTLAAYQHEGYNRFTLREFLAPIEQTATLCGMRFVPPFVIGGAHRMNEPEIEEAAQRYRALLEDLRDGRVDLDAAGAYPTLNDALERRRAESAT